MPSVLWYGSNIPTVVIAQSVWKSTLLKKNLVVVSSRLADTKKGYSTIKVECLSKNMSRLFLILFTCFVPLLACEIGHFDLWTCALKQSCMNKIQLHSSIKKTKYNLKRPFIMAIEGPRYKKLFEDCDANEDGCISMVDIKDAGQKCERSCIWRNTMKDLLC